MNVFLVEHREVVNKQWDIVVMFVGSTLETALAFCAANIKELADHVDVHSWYAICRYGVDSEVVADGELVQVYGKYGMLDEQPVNGYK